MTEYSLHWIFYKEPNIFPIFLKKLFCFQLHEYVLGHVYTCARTHRDQKNALDPQELES